MSDLSPPPARPPESGVGPVTAGAAAVGRRWNGSLIVGLALVGLVVLVALVSFAWTPYNPTRVDAPSRLLGMSGDHVFGTDRFGRDVASQLMVGSRTTLFVGVIAVGVAAVIGVPLGVVAAMSWPRVGELIMRVNDLLLAFPALLLAIMFGAVYGASTLTAMVAIGIATVPSFARVARSSALQVMRTEYVLAARVAGRRPAAVAVRHVLPNIAGILIVQASVSFAIAILAEAALSFLGLGDATADTVLGRMLQESQDLLYVAPRLAVVPGIAIAVAVLGFNLLGDGLRDRYDPKLEDRS